MYIHVGIWTPSDEKLNRTVSHKEWFVNMIKPGFKNDTSVQGLKQMAYIRANLQMAYVWSNYVSDIGHSISNKKHGNYS